MLFFFAIFRIPHNVLIKGNVYSSRSCIVIGKLEGSLHCKKTVIIKKTAQIEGNIHAKKVIIQGLVLGDVHAAKLHVATGGQVRGKILAGKVQIDEKALVEDIESVQTVEVVESTNTNNQKWF